MRPEGHVVSVRRIVAMAVAIGCHLLLLMALLRPVTPSTEGATTLESDGAALEVRFVSLPRATTPPKISTSHVLNRVVARDAPAKENSLLSVKPVMRVAALASEADTINAPPPTVTSTAAIGSEYTNSPSSLGDGGFRDRVSNAQHSQGIDRVPGSDRRVAPGIELADPMDQGIGSVMRSTQRLFGVTNHHCIDVDVLSHLSPDELKDRHLTVADVEKESEKYHCNRPLGLNF